MVGRNINQSFARACQSAVRISDWQRVSAAWCWIIVVSISGQVRAGEPCQIQIVEASSGWPVPLVELRTVHNVRFVSDNAGKIAFDLPELMGVETWFYVEGHGYSVPKDGFGFRGVRLTPEAGATLTVKVERQQAARRLGRITGAGLFGESQQLGLDPDWQESGILGCDSVQTAIYQQRIYWFWGDTNLAHFPLGIFHTSGATTRLQPVRTFEPPVKLKFDYVTDAAQRPRAVAKIPGEGPTWIDGAISLPDAQGNMHLVATYAKIDPPLSVYECGLCIWNDEAQKFEQHKVLWNRASSETTQPPLRPGGHPLLHTDQDGKQWVLFGDPFPYLKCPASVEAWSDPKQWISISPQETVECKSSSRVVKPHRGSIAWNGFRKKWVAVFTEIDGESSFLGDVWFTEANQPTGPWGPAVKIATHSNYSFYNPCLHPEMTNENSPLLIFEGTYTRLFADHAEASPRHEYNQVLYRLDLDDETYFESLK